MMFLKLLTITASLIFVFTSTLQATEGSTNLYQLPLTWQSDQDKKIELKEFKGKEVLIAMAYTSCQSACPLIVNKLKSAQRAFKKAKRSIEIVVVSFDSWTDTPAKLHHFREHMGIKDPHWTLLVGDESSTRKLGMLLDIKFGRNPVSGEISHDNKIILLDQNGSIAKTIDGLDAKVAALLK